MKQVVFIPLDERPCNYKFPPFLFDGCGMELIYPEKLGDKKMPAETDEIASFLRENCREADGLVIALDMLLYGGLIPSRLHARESEELLARLELLRELKENNPELIIYAFQIVMRCPTYSSDDEEPPYYEKYGAEIHQLGAARHKALCGDEEAAAEEARLENIVPADYLADYLDRRAVNLQANLAAMQLAKEGIIDFLAITQDDSRPWGFTALDQGILREEVKTLRLQQKVYIYPGSDEPGMILLARLANAFAGRKPAVYVSYASEGGRFVVPLYEDRPLGEIVRWQLAAAGLRQVTSPEEADFILAVTAPPANMAEAGVQPRYDLDYDVRRSLQPWFEDLCYWLDRGKPVTICDNAYANGGDLELMGILDASGRMQELAGYAGWNTSSNTMGTSIGMAVRHLYMGHDGRHMAFLLLRYVEDFAYQSAVRQQVEKLDLPALGMNYYDVAEAEGEAARCVEKRLKQFVREEMPSIADQIVWERVRLPWRRMFEVDLELRLAE